MSPDPVKRGEPAIADGEARAAAQTVFDRPLVLEAGAGTGKTTTLVARVLAWALGAGWERAIEALAERPGAERDEIASDGERIAVRLLQGVVAITFTEAAAAEMAHRIGDELGRLAVGGEPPAWLLADGLPAPEERRRRARALLATLDHLVVRTFHAWSHALLSAHPLEAGLHPELTVDADGSLLDEVVRETVEAALPEAYGDPGSPVFLELTRLGYGPPKLVEALLRLALAGMPAAELETDPFGPGRADAFLSELGSVCGEFDGVIAGPLAGASGIKNAVAIAEGVRRLVETLGENGSAGADLPTVLDLIADHFPDNLRGHVKKWSKGRFGKKETALFDDAPGGSEAVERHSAAMLHMLEAAERLDPELITAARRALAPLLASVQATLRQRGIVTFNDLLIEAARLLERREDVRRGVRRSLDQLLVDEFQDTDPLQCEVVGWLALDGPENERPGLFLVGDPKQSIYGWRNADLAAYDSFVERVLAAGGERHTLVTNFRSLPTILDEVSRSIAPVMVERRGVQPAFQPLLPSPALAGERHADPPAEAPAGTPTGSHTGAPPPRAAGERAAVERAAVERAAVEYWVSWCGEDPEHPERSRLTAVAELEAEALARDLVRLHREGVAWSEMALLFRSTSDLDIYLGALRRRRVPFAVARDKHYYRRREVIEAAALVRTVLDPGDHLALLTVLRSSMVGVPDAALIPLWRRQLPQLVTELEAPDRDALERLAARVREAAEATPRDVPGIERVDGWPAALLAFLDALADARAAFGREPADRFVERLRTLFLAEPVEAARYLGPYRLANLDRFFTRLLDTLEEGGGNATALLRMLRASVAEAIEAEEARPEEVLEDAVAVTTIHTAKGLDWEHVYLAQLHKRSGGEFGPDTEAVRIDGGWEYRLFGAATLGWQAVEERRQEVEDAERVRTLYVAMTRAERRMVLVGLWPGGAGMDGWEPPDADRAQTHLDLLCRRPVSPPGALGELWRQAGSGGPGLVWHDGAGALWRFPVHDRPSVGGTGEAAPPAEEEDETTLLPSPRQVAEAVDELTARRADAVERMARPASAAASAEAHQRLAELAADEGLGLTAEAAERRGAARTAGRIVHRVLEEIDLERAAAAPDEALAAIRDRLGSLLPSAPGSTGTTEAAAERERALGLADELLGRLAGGRLLARFGAIAPRVAARELSVLLPPTAGDEPGTAAVGFVAGFVDLLYRDPDDDAWVVADYKTDQVAPGVEVTRRAAVYAPQGAVYARAVREALDLPEEPRVELWFLAADEIVEVDGSIAGEADGPANGPAKDPAAPPDDDPGPADSQLSLFGDPG